jgi:hypothetical protein
MPIPLIDTPVRASHALGYIEITMASGNRFRFSVAANPRLRSGSDIQLNDIELSPFGLHWSKLDEDLSIRGIAAGDFGQEPKKGA